MPTMKTLRTLPVFLALLLAAVAAEGAETLKEKLDRTLPLKAGSQMYLSNVNGAVTIEAWDRDEVRIEAEKRVKAGSAEAARKYMAQLKIEITPSAGGLRVETRHPRRQTGFFEWLFGNDVSAGVTYRIHVPRRVALQAVNINGAVMATGLRGRTQLETTNGSVTVGNVQGSMVLESTNGAIEITRSAGALRAGTTNGGIDAQLMSLPEGSEIRLASTNGAISLRIPRDARMSIDAGTVNGRVHSDLPLEGGQPGKRSLTAELNGGGGKLYAHTTNGSIDINSVK